MLSCRKFLLLGWLGATSLASLSLIRSMRRSGLHAFDPTDERLCLAKSCSSLLTASTRQQAEDIGLAVDVKATNTIQRKTWPAIDILSTGSVHRMDLLTTQKNTFGSHSSIRHFFPLTEHNDTEADCHAKLDYDQAMRIASYCHQRRKSIQFLDELSEVYIHRAILRQKANPAGWICAQKRPIDGLISVLKLYRSNIMPWPDYLILIDDDTWLNIDHVVRFMESNYPPQDAHAVAGCLIRLQQPRHFTIPFGGYGTFLTRRALQNFVMPIADCNHGRQPVKRPVEPLNDADVFDKAACWRLKQNLIGEESLFEPGMSVADLMAAFSFNQPFLEFENWSDVGFCFHSDMAIAYFLNYYHIPIHAKMLPSAPQDRLQAYDMSTWFRGLNDPQHMAWRRQCNHKADGNCTATSHICHYISSAHMNELHQQIKVASRIEN